MRGDEPSETVMAKTVQDAFPACAGMNRSDCARIGHACGVPRMRGDEPTIITFCCSTTARSPHARG